MQQFQSCSPNVILQQFSWYLVSDIIISLVKTPQDNNKVEIYNVDNTLLTHY